MRKHRLLDLYPINSKFLYVILPLLFLIILSNNAYAIDLDLECPENKVVVIRTTNPDPICVFDTTATRWIQLGLVEIVEPIKIETEIVIEKEISEQEFQKVISSPYAPNDLSRAQSYLITFSDGDFTEPLTFQTFSKVQPGDVEHYLPSFLDTDFDTYFSLESIPSIDKIEFYNTIAKTLNPGRPPQLFDVAIDVLSGDNSVILTTNYSKCEFTGYVPYSQEFTLFYQYSDVTNDEIRDSATMYCAGLNIQSYNQENPKLIQTDFLPFNPSSDSSVYGYIVHFSGPDFPGLYTVETFSDFSPSVNFHESPYDVITIPGNNFDDKPRFFLESLPSKDKEILYEYFGKWINPGQPPEPVDVSIDMITGDGTILQRWNYADCSFEDYTTFLEDSKLKFSYTGERSSEIRDKSQFSCAGINLEIHGSKPIPKYPISDQNSSLNPLSPKIPDSSERAQSFEISAFGGELTQIYLSEKIQKFEPVSRNRGPLTPVNHAKQYEYGFVIESLPEKEKSTYYEFISRYVNPGKSPEPFDVHINTKNGDGTILHQLQYSNCEGIDFLWYLQQANFFYQFSQQESDEIRERYIFYCDGFGIDFPK